jgi:hypothetical protein
MELLSLRRVAGKGAAAAWDLQGMVTSMKEAVPKGWSREKQKLPQKNLVGPNFIF